MSDASMNYLYTIGGYATLLGFGYIIYSVSSTQKAKKRGAAAPAKAPKAAQSEGRKDDRKKKQRLESFASEAQESSKAKAPAQVPEPSSSANNDVPDDSAINRKFANDLAKAKEGTKFNASNDRSKQREKSVKQSRANKAAGIEDKTPTPAPVADREEKPSPSTSTNEADAEDDAPEAPVDASGVADMLEPARTSGPSVMRITDTTEKKQNKPAKAPEQKESKKQRQNRQKAEDAKVAREEAEKERKALEQKQRRAARVAEGRAAKDGSQFLASNGTKSAWTQGAPNGDTNTSAKVSTINESDVFHAPLDTYEQPETKLSKKQPAASKSDQGWASSLPSEEEQMKLLAGDDEWSTVKTKSSKKTKKNSATDSGDEPAQSRPSAQPKQSSATTAKSSKPAPSQSFGGSFSALETKDSAADEAEEEWEV